MKGCFLLQRRFAYIGHELVKILKEKYGVKEFCGYVSLRSSFDFLRSQKEISYSNLLLEEDVYARYKNTELDFKYLDYLEKEYGLPNLWPYLMMDRVIRYNQLVRFYPWDKSKYSHEEMMKILQATAKAIIEFLDKEKPDFIFFSVVANLSSFLLYEIARKKNIKTLILDYSRFEIKYFLSERCDQ